MPELPEVETTRRGISPHLIGHRIVDTIIRNRNLRWPITKNFAAHIRGQHIQAIQRRAKYLLLQLDNGNIILHLGMSGHLRVLDSAQPAGKHDHIDIILDTGQCLRFNDPRRFGAVLWTQDDPLHHPLLKDLGPEPLDKTFNGAYLYQRSRKRKIAIKQFLMNNNIVVGIGNIYANEALFMAGIHPTRSAGRISIARYEQLAAAIKQVLRHAIKQGGTTLRDFMDTNGKPGYFQLRLKIYGRQGEPCPMCGYTIKHLNQGQRSSYYCSRCQT